MHKATLVDGTIVAVKVQHPLVKMFSQADMKCMEVGLHYKSPFENRLYNKQCFPFQLLADIAGWFFPDFKLQWLVDETKRNLPCELNFVMEGKNSEKTASLMKHLPWLHVNFFFIFLCKLI